MLMCKSFTCDRLLMIRHRLQHSSREDVPYFDNIVSGRNDSGSRWQHHQGLDGVLVGQRHDRVLRANVPKLDRVVVSSCEI